MSEIPSIQKQLQHSRYQSQNQASAKYNTAQDQGDGQANPQKQKKQGGSAGPSSIVSISSASLEAAKEYQARRIQQDQDQYGDDQ